MISRTIKFSHNTNNNANKLANTVRPPSGNAKTHYKRGGVGGSLNHKNLEVQEFIKKNGNIRAFKIKLLFFGSEENILSFLTPNT